MNFSRREKFMQWLLPYWCDICGRRFRRLEKFDKHYWPCKHDYDMKITKTLERVAPVNRRQRRNMAKKAGQIKDWDKLNNA